MSQNPSTFLDAILMKLVQAAGVAVQTRTALNFLGPRFLLADNPSNDSTDVSLVPSVSAPVTVTTGTVILNATQAANEIVVLTGTLTANATVVLPSNLGQTWTVDVTGITFAGHTITLQANGNNWSVGIAVAGLYRVVFNGTRLYGNTLAS